MILDVACRLLKGGRNFGTPPEERDLMNRSAVLALALAAGLLVFAPPARASDARWSELGPPLRTRHTLVYDSTDDRLVLFGGSTDLVSVRNEVWTISLGDPAAVWHEHVVEGPLPSPRQDHAAVFDPVGDRMIVFGGRDAAGAPLGDTWILELSGAPRWTQRPDLGPAPGPRYSPGAIYDPVDHQIVLVGGWSSETLNRRDVWTLSLDASLAWAPFPVERATTSSSLPGVYADAVYDVVSRSIFTAGPSGEWSFELGSPAPRWERSWHWLQGFESFAFDPVDRRLLSLDRSVLRSVDLFPGQPLEQQPLHPMAWGMDVPRALTGQSLVYDPVRRRLLTFGGEAADSDRRGKLDQALWAFDLEGGATWSSVGPGAHPRRGQVVLVRDTQRDRLIHFGWGENAQWLFARGLAPEGTWHQLGDSAWFEANSIGVQSSTVYDTRRDRLLLFQRDNGGDATPVFELSLAGAPLSVNPLGVTAPALPRNEICRGDGGGAIYDELRDRLVVFHLGADQHEVWALSLAEPMAWTRLDASGPRPSLTTQQIWIWDRQGDRLVVLGGLPPYLSNEVPVIWTLGLGGGSAWSILETSGGPELRRDMTAAYDPVRRRILAAIGPRDGSIDLWALELAGAPAWRRLQAYGAGVSAPELASSIFDPLRDRMLSYGGMPPERSLWSLAFDEQTTATLPALLDAAADANGIRVRWTVIGNEGPCTLERLDASGAWAFRASLAEDASHIVAFLDQDVVAGAQYSYRLQVPTSDGVQTTATVTVTAAASPAPAFALRGVRPNPSAEAFELSFVLAEGGDVRLELFDVEGRRVFARDGGALAPGPHTWRLDPGPLRAGLYFARLRQGGAELRSRILRLR